MACGEDPQMLPNGKDGVAFECTHITSSNGLFLQGLEANVVGGVTYTFSFFFKNGNFATPFDQPVANIGLMVNGFSGSGGASLTMIDAFPNSWYRQKFTFTAKGTGTAKFYFTQSLNLMPGGGYWLYGFQVETGSIATEYIP